MELPNFKNIDYLNSGTQRQKAAYRALLSTNILHVLKNYSPILTGTIPIDIDLKESDLDIICSSRDLNQFCAYIVCEFKHYEDFKLIQGKEEVVASFKAFEFEFELFCQNLATEKQNAFLHMIAEARMLYFGGEALKKEIRALKASGLKTEPAFARFFNLPNDPYQAVLNLNNLSDNDLKELVSSSLNS